MTDLPWDEPLEDLPGFRSALEAIRRPSAPAEAWHILWGRLVDQEDIDHTGILAVPLLADMASQLPPADRFEHLILIGSIAYCAMLPNSKWVVEAAPKDVRLKFELALDQAVEMIASDLRNKSGFWQTKALLECYAAVRGFGALTECLEHLEDSIFCTKCGSDFEREHRFAAPPQ